MRVKLSELSQALKARDNTAQGAGRAAAEALGYRAENGSPARAEQNPVSPLQGSALTVPSTLGFAVSRFQRYQA
jgi:hypothetical protein